MFFNNIHSRVRLNKGKLKYTFHITLSLYFLENDTKLLHKKTCTSSISYHFQRNKQQSIRCKKIQELSIKQDHQSKTNHYKKQAHDRLKAKQHIKNPESER